MKKLIYILLLLPLFAFSQGKIVSGVVNDDMGGPLPGATVQVKGSESIGSITDFDGKFTIALKAVKMLLPQAVTIQVKNNKTDLMELILEISKTFKY